MTLVILFCDLYEEKKTIKNLINIILKYFTVLKFEGFGLNLNFEFSENFS